MDLQNGQVRDPLSGATRLHAMREQLNHWQGRIYEKLASNLTHKARSLIAYYALLQQALAPLVEQ